MNVKKVSCTSIDYVIWCNYIYVSSKYHSLFHIIKCRSENKESKFVIGPKGSGTCSEGSPITDEMTCRKACRSLNIPEEEILGNHKCYIDRFGDCYQNGLHQSGSDSGSSLICRTSEQSAGKFWNGWKNPGALYA